MGDDPRTDRHPGDGPTPNIPVPPGDAKKSPDGIGSGKEGDPAKEPAAQPK